MEGKFFKVCLIMRHNSFLSGVMFTFFKSSSEGMFIDLRELEIEMVRERAGGGGRGRKRGTERLV